MSLRLCSAEQWGRGGRGSSFAVCFVSDSFFVHYALVLYICRLVSWQLHRLQGTWAPIMERSSPVPLHLALLASLDHGPSVFDVATRGHSIQGEEKRPH